MMWKILRNLFTYQMEAIGCTIEKTKQGDIMVYNTTDGNFVKVTFIQGAISNEQMRILRK